MKISGRMQVKTLKKEFLQEFGLQIRVYEGNMFADDDATIASLRKEGQIKGDFSPQKNMKVGSFEDNMSDKFGLKVQIAGSDDSYLCDNNLTLSKALVKDEKKLEKKLQKKKSEIDVIDEGDNSKTEHQDINLDVDEFKTKISEIIKSNQDDVDKIKALTKLGGDYIDEHQDELLNQPSDKEDEFGDTMTMYHEFCEAYVEGLEDLKFDSMPTFETLTLLFDEFRPSQEYSKGHDEELLEEVVDALNTVDIPKDLSLEDLYYDYLAHTSEEYYTVEPEKLSQYPQIILDEYDADEIIEWLFDEDYGKILGYSNEDQIKKFYKIVKEHADDFEDYEEYFEEYEDYL